MPGERRVLADSSSAKVRALQEGEVDPIGSRRSVKVGVRIVSATNRDLANSFRPGLSARTSTIASTSIRSGAPPLRDRREDIPALVDHSVPRFNVEEDLRAWSAPSRRALAPS